MVTKENPLYLFLGRDIIGQDGLSRKDATLKKIKESLLPKEVEQFNLDTLYAKELDLKSLQEKLLCIPIKANKRIIVIKGAERLKDDIKDCILGYVKKGNRQAVLVLDINDYSHKDEFVRRIRAYAKVQTFNDTREADTFTLSRFVDSKKTTEALRVLSYLLENGEKPERILGGLRYSWENNPASPAEVRIKMKLLLNCDIAIKTGRLKSVFALERLLVNLCSLAKFSG